MAAPDDGDTLTFHFYESIVSQVRKAGDPAPPPSGGPTLARGTGPRPSGTVSQQFRATVTVKEIDASVPSLTVETEDGRTTSFKIADKGHLEGVEPGDRVDITNTAAVIIAVRKARGFGGEEPLSVPQEGLQREEMSS